MSSKNDSKKALTNNSMSIPMPISRWNKALIRTLRLRLGYSQAEFARRLSMETSDIDFMEQGLLVPSPILSGDLEILMRQVDSDYEENRKCQLSECKVDDRL